jgi:hypothetical protein
MAKKRPPNKDSNVTVAIMGAVATITAAIVGVVAVWLNRLPPTPNPTTTDSTRTVTTVPVTSTAMNCFQMRKKSDWEPRYSLLIKK